MSDQMKPCPFCGSDDIGYQTYDKNISRDFVICNDCGVSAQRGNCEAEPVEVWNRRTAPSAPMGEELPVLKIEKIVQLIDEHTDRHFGLIVEPFARAIAKEAVAPYAERIRQLERELAERASSPEIPDSSQSIGDEPEFERLRAEYVKALDGNLETYATAKRALIAYIDGRTAGTMQADPFAGQRFLNWNRSQDKPPVAIGKELGVARKVLEFAAAPTPMNSGKEEGK